MAIKFPVSRDQSEASRMLKLWMCFSVFYVLLCRVSGDEGVSLTCPANVTAGSDGTVSLHCSITWKKEDCDHTKCIVYSTINDMPMEKDTCKWSNETDVVLTIANITKAGNVTVTLVSNCGMDKTSFEVLITEVPPTPGKIKATENPGDPVGQKVPYVRYITGGAVAVTAVGLCFFLFKTRLSKKYSSDSAESLI